MVNYSWCRLAVRAAWLCYATQVLENSVLLAGLHGDPSCHKYSMAAENNLSSTRFQLIALAGKGVESRRGEWPRRCYPNPCFGFRVTGSFKPLNPKPAPKP